MKTLPQVKATREQLPLISQTRLGVEVICGAAGSGKTSTALLRLRSLCHMFLARHARNENVNPVKILVLTFNRTLAGYLRTLAKQQIDAGLNINLQIDTFAKWSMSALGSPDVKNDAAQKKLRSLTNAIGGLSRDYLIKEVDYILGRFKKENVNEYITIERTGRGSLPRVDRVLRQRILNEIVIPYQEWLFENNVLDWNGVALAMSSKIPSQDYDVIIVDESQDFSANQLRAVRHHLAKDFAATFVIDTVQRIYSRGFTWVEIGFDVRPERIHLLKENHRNTKQIAAFAQGILNGISIEGNGALPDLNSAYSIGSIPIVLKGKYSKQFAWVAELIHTSVDLKNDSIAFLQPKGGGWFDDLKNMLHTAGLDFVEITKEAEWPDGDENIALSTFHSAKGLEFDHVFILGLNDKNTFYDVAEVDDQIFVLRRLLGVAIARARKTVVIGYKPGEQSQLIEYFVPNTYTEVSV